MRSRGYCVFCGDREEYVAELLKPGHRVGRYEIGRVVCQGVVCTDYEASVSGREETLIVREYLPGGLARRSDDGRISPNSAGNRFEFETGLNGFIAQCEGLRHIAHRAIQSVLDCIQDNNTAYTVLPREAGQTLATHLERRKTLQQVDLTKVIYPIIDGLEKVHQADLLHQQISPENVVLRLDGSPVLTGLCEVRPGATAGGPRRSIGGRSLNLTARLNAGYAAMEQYAQHGLVGPWTDIYALGAVMYRCVSGSAPSEAPIRGVDDDLVPAGQAARGDYDSHILDGIDAALSLRVGDRPPSIAAWRISLTGKKRPRDAANAPRGRMLARQFQPRSALPTVASSTDKGAHRETALRSEKRAVSWAVPALAATAFITLLTYLDAGILRTDKEDLAVPQAAANEIVAKQPDHGATASIPNADAYNDSSVNRDSANPMGGKRTQPGRLASAMPQAGRGEDPGLPGVTRLEGQADPPPDLEIDALTEVAIQTRRPIETNQPPSSTFPQHLNTESDDESDLVATSQKAPDAKNDAVPGASNTNRAVVVVSRGSLTVEAEPTDAEVTLLEENAPPYVPGVDLHEGSYGIPIERDDYVSETRTVRVAGNTRVQVSLSPAPQPFTVFAIPAKASVTMENGGNSYSPGMRLPPGQYQVTVSHVGYQRWTGQIDHGTSPTRREIRLVEMEKEFSDALASGGYGPVMVLMLPGEFRSGCISGNPCLGSELPVRDELITEHVALSKYEVTFYEYDRFTVAAGHRPAANWNSRQRGRHPVVNVSWADANAYATWLSAETDRSYRLPSESEWEYGTRAGTETTYSWGNEAIGTFANCAGCRRLRERGTQPVGSYDPNDWGLHDVHGNVWEWVAGCPTQPRLVTNAIGSGKGSVSCERRIRRGGSWMHSPQHMGAASRDLANPNLRSPNTGFRVLREFQ